MHSNKVKKEKFTNYIKSYGNAYYNILCDLFRKLYYDNYNILNEHYKLI